MRRPGLAGVGTFLAGALLLGGGTYMVGVADHERVAALDAVKAKVEKTKNTIDRSKAENVRLAETLTSLRSEVAEQEKKLADTNGFLQ